MTFQEQTAADIATFINPMEFAVVRVVDGAPVACVLDDHDRSEGGGEGVYVSASLLYVRASDLPAVPVLTQRMVVDGKAGRVTHVDDQMGVLAVRLEWFES